uniref:Uncharacterized protein n=1 Tax=Anguilla anguilla TaxID=7936 RepID=A0A0E9RNK1_ANGAN
MDCASLYFMEYEVANHISWVWEIPQGKCNQSLCDVGAKSDIFCHVSPDK